MAEPPLLVATPSSPIRLPGSLYSKSFWGTLIICFANWWWDWGFYYILEYSAEVADIDWDNIGFGLKPTDYMYVMKCNLDGEFSKGELQRFGNIEVSPSAGVLNYGQVFVSSKCHLLYCYWVLLVCVCRDCSKEWKLTDSKTVRTSSSFVLKRMQRVWEVVPRGCVCLLLPLTSLSKLSKQPY